MVCSCQDGDLCIDYFSSSNDSNNYGCTEKDKANEKTQDHPAIDFHSTTSAKQYKYSVLEAYGIVPVARKEQKEFLLCGNEMRRSDSRGNKTISVFKKESHNQRKERNEFQKDAL